MEPETNNNNKIATTKQRRKSKTITNTKNKKHSSSSPNNNDNSSNFLKTPIEILHEMWKELSCNIFNKSQLLQVFLIPIMLNVVVLLLYFGSAKSFLQITKQMNWLQQDPMLDWYQYLFYHVNTCFMLGIFPMLIVRFGFGVQFKEMGIQLGDSRRGLSFLLTGILVMTPLVWISSLDPDMRKEYPLTKLAGTFAPQSWLLWWFTYLIYYIGWEIFHRGLLLLILKRTSLGYHGAMAYQVSVSTLIHLSGGMKPFMETSAAITGGYVFGIATIHTNSILWALLLHWYIGGLLDYLVYYY
jgi:hypothetical protein